MNYEFLPAVENEDERFEEVAFGVETEPKLRGRAIVIEIPYPKSLSLGPYGVHGFNPVLQRGWVSRHAPASASRMTSDRDLPSRSARASRSATS